MEDSVKDQSSVSANARRSSSKLVRYPLRSSASKSKEDKLPLTDFSNSKASARGKLVSSVSKSISVLHLSGKEQSGKPPRRLSVPSKPVASPASRPLGAITPISETRAKRSATASNQGKSDTPLSNVSKSSIRKKYDLISSSSYWLSQIKFSESAAKHSISLGLFKLALEAGSEPLQRLRDELKSYVQRHSLVELGEPVKQLFDSYNIPQDFDHLQVSETCSHVPNDGTRSSDDDVRSSSSVVDTQRLKPRVLNKDSTETKQVKGPTKDKSPKFGSTPKIRNSVNKTAATVTPKTRNSVNKIAATATSTNQKVVGRITKEKLQKPVKQEPNKDKVKRQGKKSAQGEGPVSACTPERALEEDKENVNTPQTEAIST